MLSRRHSQLTLQAAQTKPEKPFWVVPREEINEEDNNPRMYGVVGFRSRFPGLVVTAIINYVIHDYVIHDYVLIM